MIARLLLGLLSDLIFNRADAAGRAYADEFSRYLDRRGFPRDDRRPRPKTR